MREALEKIMEAESLLRGATAILERALEGTPAVYRKDGQTTRFYCGRCGAGTQYGDKYCRECGGRISWEG